MKNGIADAQQIALIVLDLSKVTYRGNVLSPPKRCLISGL